MRKESLIRVAERAIKEFEKKKKLEEKEVRAARKIQEAEEKRRAKELIAQTDEKIVTEASKGYHRVEVTSIGDSQINETSSDKYGQNWKLYHAEDLLGVPRRVAQHYEKKKGFRVLIYQEDLGPWATSAVRPHIMMDVKWEKK